MLHNRWHSIIIFFGVYCNGINHDESFNSSCTNSQHCIAIYQEIIYIFTTLPLFREEPEEKHFNWIIVFGIPWEHSHHWVSPFSEVSCLLCISMAFTFYWFDTPSNSPYLKKALFSSVFLLDIEPSLIPTTCQYRGPTRETADYRECSFYKEDRIFWFKDLLNTVEGEGLVLIEHPRCMTMPGTCWKPTHGPFLCSVSLYVTLTRTVI